MSQEVGDAARGAGRAPLWVAVAITALYASIVIVTSVHHEPWRDEVVPLSIAREADSTVDLARTLSFEGHPALWYVCLRYAHLVIGHSYALKILSVTCAIAAIFVFLWRAALPLWFRTLFVLGYIPLYQYSVVSRSYSLSMLLLFVYCWLYTRRLERPVRVALVLAAIANCHVFGLIVAVAAGLSLAVERIAARRREGQIRPGRLAAAVAIYLAGIAFSIALAFPDPAFTAATVDWPTIAAGIGRALLQPLGHSGSFFFVPAPSLLIWLFFLFLLPRPALLAFAGVAVVATELVFTLVWPPAPWHLGTVLLVIVATLWLYRAEPPRQRGTMPV